MGLESKMLWILEENPELRNVLCYLAEQRGYRVEKFPNISEIRHRLLRDFPKLSKYHDLTFVSEFAPKGEYSATFLMETRLLLPTARFVCYSSHVDTELHGTVNSMGVRMMSKPNFLSDFFEVLDAVESK